MKGIWKEVMGFSLSFLQLYLHEDDVLFKVLLQLLSVPSCSEQWFNGDKKTSQYLKDATHHVSNLFNPLHYDHQVLLDYLISKDIGISCAEYLLRCLRMVHNSWNIFAAFSMDWKVLNQSCSKKRRLLLDVSDFQGELSSLPVQCISQSLGEEDEKDFEYAYENHQNKRPPFKEAKDCLISLKASVESLHRKNLFPYNPQVLLKRLTQFQELCHS
uniref:Protein Lines C-terminal domain-containing protein n=1 Tax=Salix viminalis TaxID=40686 RepID=A0A6N2NED7_SALVM